MIAAQRMSIISNSYRKTLTCTYRLSFQRDFSLKMNYRQQCIFLLFSFLIVSQDISCLHLTSDKISTQLLLDGTTDARLECNYDLDDDVLYSIRWYKNMREFYRFTPQEIPSAKVFPSIGLIVDISKSNSTIVVVKSIDESGSYRCEVTGEPSFTTVYQETK